MARQKSTPVQRTPSTETYPRVDKLVKEQQRAEVQLHPSELQAGLPQLIICVGGIYASFLTWGVLQERITTRSYPSPGATLLTTTSERWTYPIVLNTIQSLFAFLTGYCYLRLSNRHSRSIPAIIPTTTLLTSLLLIAITSSLASPFGYASLQHIDYLTFILAKSCKLLPVMFLHLTIFRRRYPLYKYAVVALVTTGVAIFTLHHPRTARKSTTTSLERNPTWGLMLLGVNLLFDGLTNSTQDYIFDRWRPYSGPQMMCAQNAMTTILTGIYLTLAPSLVALAPGWADDWIGVLGSAQGELREALAFITRHPAVGRDVILFGFFGAVGQVFIFYTLATFSSLLLVTVTVTRKMLTMILSVVWFGHRLRGRQWAGVGLVFGGVAAEAWIGKREKNAKAVLAKKKREEKDL